MKNTGKGACILPHGVLFRGNAEAVIRRNLVRSGILKGIIGLPANLFYGTGIPACILVLDKENATARKGIFMIDASKGFIKDGNKNRLRERDLHQIVDVFTHAEEHPGYSRHVPHDEIEKNDFNLNLPRYIDTQEAEDIQDIGGHLHGGIPTRDLDALHEYWEICPALRAALFQPNRPGYHDLLVEAAQLKPTIHGHPEFSTFIAGLETHFVKWRQAASLSLRQLRVDCLPKQVIHDLSENLLHHAESQLLIDPYAVYQHLLDYWGATMQDDCYLIAADGWVAKTSRIMEIDKKGQTKDKGWTCDLVPKPLIVARYFAKEQAAIDALTAQLETVTAGLAEVTEEHGGEDGVLKDVSSKGDAQVAYTEAVVALWNSEDKQACTAYSTAMETADRHRADLRSLTDNIHCSALKNAKGKLTLTTVKARLVKLSTGVEHDKLAEYVRTDKYLKDATKQALELFAGAESTFIARLADNPTPAMMGDLQAVVQFMKLLEQQTTLKAQVREAETALDLLACQKYPQLTEPEVQTLVVDDKWLATLATAIQGELDRVSQTLTSRIRLLADRYAAPLPQIVDEVGQLEAKVAAHLQKMGAY
jgi:type I restriction enzyme M protein